MDGWVTHWLDDLDDMLRTLTQTTYSAIAADLGEAFIAMAVLAVVLWMFAAIFHLGDNATLQLLAKIAVIPSLLFAFATEWEFFSVTVYELVTNGTSDLIGTVTDDLPVWEQLDRFTTSVKTHGDNVFDKGGWGAAIVWWMLAGILSFMLMIMAGTAVAIISAAKFAIAILLGLAPLFIMAVLFEATRPIFSRWVGHIIGFALASVLICLTVKAMLILSLRQLLGLNSIGVDELSFDPIWRLISVLFISWLFFMATPFIAASIAGGYALTIRQGVAGALMSAGGRLKGLMNKGPTPSQAWSRLNGRTRTIRQR